MTQKMGWLSVYAYTERKGGVVGGAVRCRWRLHSWNGTVLARSDGSFADEVAAYASAERVSRLLNSVMTVRRKRAA